MYVQDVVIPLATTREGPDGVEVDRLLGTAFLIGRRGVALTAAHVVEGDVSGLAALVVTDEGWNAIPITSWERHPTEDVAALKLETTPGASWLVLRGEWEGQSLSYRSFGYPVDVLHEVVDAGISTPRPDLVYSAGYIRRRLTVHLPMLRGTQFFELSEPAGAGCSGAPVLRTESGQTWAVIGIYVGERMLGDPSRRDQPPIVVGYAVREEAFRDWAPAFVGTTLLAESHDT